MAVAHGWLHRSIRAWFTSLFHRHPVVWVGTSWDLPVYSWHVLTIQTHAGLLIWTLWLACRCECEYECVCWCLPAPVWQTGNWCTLGWAPASYDLEQAKRFRNGWMPDSVTSQWYLVRGKQAFPQEWDTCGSAPLIISDTLFGPQLMFFPGNLLFIFLIMIINQNN